MSVRVFFDYPEKVSSISVKKKVINYYRVQIISALSSLRITFFEALISSLS